ncbi:MAG TPA: ATP-binding cassette domain-containing protein [Acidobacteriota bacterium]|nr:ATP-binding cassette domain-containing protein [Acidobacteriota bacterium]
MAAIQVSRLSKNYLDRSRGVVPAVREISFDCHFGEIVGLLGPNGAGKTTTLRMLATVLEPTSGDARIADYDIRAESLEVRKRLGFLTGGTGLYARLTPLETFRFFGKLNEMTDAQIAERTEALLAAFDMREFAGSHCDKLSTGQRQRVNLARTLIHNPPVLILDEPTAGLDIMSSRTILDFIRNAKNESKCVLFSTHNMTEAEILCDRVAIIVGGRILAFDTIPKLKETTGCNSLVEVFFRLAEQHETQPN